MVQLAPVRILFSYNPLSLSSSALAIIPSVIFSIPRLCVLVLTRVQVKQISLSINLSASFFLGDNAKDIQLSHYLDIVDKAAQLLVTVDKCTKDINHGYIFYSLFNHCCFSYSHNMLFFVIRSSSTFHPL